MLIGTSPPNFFITPSSQNAAFTAEEIDPEWRQKMFEEISSRLSVIEEGLESAQIDCRSSTCRVELVAKQPGTTQEWIKERLEVLFRETRQLGFNVANTEFIPGGTTTLSYLTTTRPGSAPALPPGLPPGFAESFQQSIQDSAQALLDGASLSGEPVTVLGIPSAPAGR